MASSSGRLDAMQVASDWISRTIDGEFYVVPELFRELVYQAAIFLLMDYDTRELAVWRNGHNSVEVVPLSIVSDGQ